MKKPLLLLFVAIAFCLNGTFAALDKINFKNITYRNDLASPLKFLAQNEHLVRFWTPEWKSSVPKKDFIENLDLLYTLSVRHAKSYDEFLLKGLVAHYLFNIGVEHYFDSCVKALNKAIDLKDSRYEAYYFLGNHYCRSSKAELAARYFLKAEKKIGPEQSGEFWEDYAVAFYLASMPAHCIKGFDKAFKFFKQPSQLESSILPGLKAKIKTPHPDSAYERDALWMMEEKKGLGIFRSKPLGLRFQADTAWKIIIPKFANRTGFAILTPDTVKTPKGNEVTFTMLVLAYLPRKGETLDGFSKNILKKASLIKPDSTFKHLDPGIAYELQDSSIYAHLGGGHVHLLGFERQEPAYPGLMIEVPENIKAGDEGLKFFNYSNSFRRFEGKIFYFFLLDTCEDAYPQSQETFRKFIETITLEN